MLEVKSVTRRFGGLIAVDRVSFSLRKGEILGLIGPNGAGKSTLLNIIAGTLRATSGSIILEEREITKLPFHKVSEAKVVKTFQAAQIFENMSVVENVMLGFHCEVESGLIGSLFRTKRYLSEEQEIRIQATSMLQIFGMEALKDVPAERLPHGHRRMLGICMAKACKPKVLLLDEPLGGLNEMEKEQVIKHISLARDKEMGVILVEHNMKAVVKNCDRIVVLNFGKKIAEGAVRDVISDKQVVEAYLGSGHHDYVTRT